MAEIEIELQDSINHVCSDEITNQLLNVVILQKDDSLSSFADNICNSVLPAPIYDFSDNIDSTMTDDIQNILIDIPLVNISDNVSNVISDGINDGDMLIDAPIQDINDSIDTGITDNISTTIIGSPPEITSIIPSGSIYSQYPLFEVIAESSCEECKIDFAVKDSGNSSVFSEFNVSMTKIGTNNGKNVFKYSLQFDKDFDFLLFDNYVCNAKVYDDFGTDEQNSNFVIIEDDTYFEITEIDKDFDNNRLILTAKQRNRNETWTSLHILFTDGVSNKNFRILDVEGEEIYIVGEKDIVIHTKPEITEYKIICEYETKSEYTDIAVKLNQKLLKIRTQCLVYDISGKEYDLTEFLSGVSYNYSTELSSKQADISFVYNSLLCPYTNTDTPLFYGNKIIIKSFLVGENQEQEFVEYIGYIKSVETDNDKISVIALDKLSRFSQKLNEDLHFCPNKITITENLRTIDGIKFKSSHSGWAMLPQPQIYVKDKLLSKGEYTVDFYRGEVYLSSNPYLDPEWIEQVVDMNDIADRKTIELYGDVNLSSSVKVKWTYMEKETYSCVNGVDGEMVWIEKTVELVETVDYSMDYENRKLILNAAIPPDNETIKNHFITISYRKDVEPVKATYTFFEAGTNTVDGITEQLAQNLGFGTENLEDVYEEEIVTKDGFNFYTKYKNIKEVLEFKVDGQDFSDYRISNGVVQTDTSFPSVEVTIDPFISVFFMTSSENTVLSVDFEDKYFETRSVVVDFQGTEKWAMKRYGSVNSNLDFSAYREVSIMAKPDRDVTLDVGLLTGDAVFVASTTANLVANEWNRITIDMSNVDVSERRNIGFIKFFADDECQVKLQYLHIPSHKAYIKYKYGTIQPTDVSINEVWFNKTDTDSYMDVLSEIYKQVDPSYVLYVDNKEKLRGEYKKLRPYYVLPILHSYNKIVSEDAYGGVVIPDYSTYMLSGFNHSIGEEQLFAAVMVVGRLSQKNNVALIGEATDVCDVVDGVPYVRTTYYTPKTGKYTHDAVLQTILGEQGYAPVPVGDRNAKTVIDSNSESGMYWYVKKNNDASRAFSNKQLMLVLELPFSVKWEEISILVGIYKNYVIREELFIEVETENGERFYPEENYPTKKQGQSGTYLKCSNKMFENKKIKKVYLYCSESARWITSKTVVGGGKK